MALSLAMPLSGLEPEHFYALGVRCHYDQGFKCLNGIGPMSPSTGSESSGVSSLTPSLESISSESSSNLSRPSTPNEAYDSATPPQIQEKPTVQLRVFYKDRDILNLGANIRGSFWQLINPSMPRYNYKMFMENRSIYYRLGENGLTEEYPTKKCDECGFTEPSSFVC